MPVMKAIRGKDYCDASALQFEDTPRPSPGPGAILVRVYTAAVNPIDSTLPAGFMKAMMPLIFPWTPGFDPSGVVESVGAGVQTLAVGDDVFGKGELLGGTYPEYVTMPAGNLARKPRAIDRVHAAAIPLAALTTWQGLFDGLELEKGQTVLVTGAAGGDGGFAVQLAKWKGTRVVAAARTAHEEHLRALGADVFVFVDTAGGLSGAGRVHAVLDLLSGEVAQKAWAQLRNAR